MKIDVIIPSYTSESLVPMIKNCITSLRESEKAISFNVVIIETNHENQIYVGENSCIMDLQKPFCYNRALNYGIKETNAEWIILANNDLYFHKSWMTKILTAHSIYSEIKSFTPWNNKWDWHTSIFGNPKTDIIEGYNICKELGGWCIIAKREIFNEIQLSEKVDFWYSDNIYADALKKAGIRHALVTKSFVDHLVSQTKVMTQLDAIQAYNQYCVIN